MKRFGFPSNSRIKSKKEISVVFEKGTSVYSKNNRLKAKYLLLENGTSGTKAAFAVFKKSGIAVWRNRVKRLLRDSFRRNQECLSAYCKENNKLLLIVFTLNSISRKNFRTIRLRDIENEMISILKTLEEKLKQGLEI